MKFKTGLLLLSVFLLSACDDGQAIFYWEKPDTGPTWFAKEHNDCLEEADWWPWSLPSWPPGHTKLPELRFDNDSDNGIWANFVPYPGAQPVYVNAKQDDSSMSISAYESCMERKGYKQRKPMERRRQVLPE